MVGHNIKNAFGGVFEHLIEQDFAQFLKLTLFCDSVVSTNSPASANNHSSL